MEPAFRKLQGDKFPPMHSGYLKFLFLFLFAFHDSFCQRPVDTSAVFTIGGIRQYVRIKGKNDSLPILLFLHGGPGGSLLQKNDRISGKLQEHFVVVQWDQRETGETLKLNSSNQPLSLEIFYSDTHDIIDTLLKKFRQPKLYLAGYSWGTVLGFYIADKYPELLYAYIAVSPVIDQWRSETIALGMLKETMGKKARKELSHVKIPFENADQLYYHRKWLRKHDGQKLVNLSLPRSFVHSWASTWFQTWLRSCDINRFESLRLINCPVYFFAGGKDYNTNSFITAEYFDKVSAPKKDLFLFADAGHELIETHADQFQEVVIDKILPATFAGDSK